MRLKLVAATFAAATVLASLAVPAYAQVRDGRTVFTTRGEDGRIHTRIIIQKRSFLDPGTETSPGESEHNYAWGLNQHGTSVLDNTTFGDNQKALPQNFDLGPRGPVIPF
jgi:hypothetical protein